MGHKGELVCAWMGPVGILLFAFAWIIVAGWWEPPLPALSADQVADVFRQGANRIRAAMVLMQYGGTLTIGFAAALAVVMVRMKGPSPALAYVQLGCAVVNALIFIIPGQMFNATAYRPDRPVDITQFGFDMGMLSFDSTAAAAMLQFIVVGLAILHDHSERPAFPRWSAFLCFFAGLLFIPSSLVTFFKHGPFTWSGLIGWYLGLIVYCAWFLAMFPLLLNAIRQQNEAAQTR